MDTDKTMSDTMALASIPGRREGKKAHLSGPGIEATMAHALKSWLQYKSHSIPPRSEALFTCSSLVSNRLYIARVH